MKTSLLLFFVFSAPIALFLATVLYSGHHRDTIKKALSDSPVYEQIANGFAEKDEQAMAQDDYPVYVSKRFTKEYFKSKTEGVIDAAADWVTGKSQAVPAVSFFELKDDLKKDQPELLQAIEDIPTEKQLQETGLDDTQTDQYLNQAKQIKTFSDNGFSVPLEQYLESFRFFYRSLQIGVPILLFLLIFSLVMIALLSHTTPSKFNSIGLTFFLSGAFGFVLSLVYSLNKTAISQINLVDQSEFITLVTPILATVFNHYVSMYISNQIIASSIFVALAGICFIAANATRKMGLPSLKPLNVKNSYWRKKSKK